MSSRSSNSRRQRDSSARGSRRTQNTAQLIESLNTHRVNTLTELCRIERVATSPSTSVEDQAFFQTPLANAWTYYVTSNNLLTELRGLTRNYPFSSECLDDAKWRVTNDPQSSMSWNYAWLVLVKMRDDQMIQLWAISDATKPEMWGGQIPEKSEADKLAACFAYEWTEALEQMLRHWDAPPTTAATGY